MFHTVSLDVNPWFVVQEFVVSRAKLCGSLFINSTGYRRLGCPTRTGQRPLKQPVRRGRQTVSWTGGPREKTGWTKTTGYQLPVRIHFFIV